jgi:hypothetical protein
VGILILAKLDRSCGKPGDPLLLSDIHKLWDVMLFLADSVRTELYCRTPTDVGELLDVRNLHTFVIEVSYVECEWRKRKAVIIIKQLSFCLVLLSHRLFITNKVAGNVSFCGNISFHFSRISAKEHSSWVVQLHVEVFF